MKKILIFLIILFSISCTKQNVNLYKSQNINLVDTVTINSALDYYSCGSSTTTVLRTVTGSTTGGSCGSSSSGSCGSSSSGSCASSSSGSSSSGSSSSNTAVDCGIIIISNNFDFIEVKINTTGNWILNKTRIYIGTTVGIPKNNNDTPKIANFPYITTHAWNTNTYILRIPRGTLTGNISIVVQADVQRVNKITSAVLENRTSWGIGTNFISSDQAQRINYNIKNCVEV